jgi:hypothetical protein
LALVVSCLRTRFHIGCNVRRGRQKPISTGEHTAFFRICFVGGAVGDGHQILGGIFIR